MPTKTGPLRRKLSTAASYLVQSIQTSSQLNQNPFNELSQSSLKDAVVDCEAAKVELEFQLQLVQQSDAEWLSVIQSIDDQTALKEEENLYSAIAEGASGYLAAIHKAFSLKAKLEARCKKMQNLISATPANPLAASMTSSVQFAHVPTPNIVLPRFDGDILKWKEFWAMFCATIHNRSDFSEVVKFTYLLPLLEGSARDAIEGIPVDNEHYAEAVAILKQQFDHGDNRVISKLLGELHRLPQCGGQLRDKRKTFHACERIFRLLKLAGDDIDSSRSLSFLLLSKFPHDMVRDLGRQYKAHTHSPLPAVRSAIEQSISEEELTAGEIEDLSLVSQPTPHSSRKAEPVFVEDPYPLSPASEPPCSTCVAASNGSRFPYSCYILLWWSTFQFRL
jgi:hypothetical protein